MRLRPKPFPAEFPRHAFWWHAAGWFAYLLYEQCLVWYTHGNPLPTAEGLFYYACNALMFYSQLGILHHCFGQQRYRYVQFFCLLPLALSLVLGIKAAGEYLLVLPKLTTRGLRMDWGQSLALDLFRNIYFTMAATLFWAASRIQGYRLKTAEAERRQLISQRDQAETQRRYGDVRNALLQQQLHPHLLSNTLNFVYSRVFSSSPEAGKCVLLLASLVRYTTGEADPDGKVPLEEEVKQIRNLVRLNQYRYYEPLQLKMEITGIYPKAQRIIPLVLLTLCENQFKHGLLDEADFPAVFSLTFSGQNQLRLYLWNRRREVSGLKRGGIGLRNLRTRLAYSYPGRHELLIDEQDETFELTLQLNL